MSENILSQKASLGTNPTPSAICAKRKMAEGEG